MEETGFRNYLLIFACMFGCAAATAQANADQSAYAAFDKIIQTKNAAFNNGKIHFNRFRPADKTHRYFKSPEFLSGGIVYDGQLYGNLSLKYDLLKDELVVKLDGERNQMGFSPVSQRTEAFYIGGVKFENLDLVPHPEFISGFYEKTFSGKIALYTKYAKAQFTVLTGEIPKYTYTEQIEFVLQHENSWQQINNERDVAAAFQRFQTEIAEFYRTNAPLEKTDRRQFMTKLASRLDELLNTAAE